VLPIANIFYPHFFSSFFHFFPRATQGPSASFLLNSVLIEDVTLTEVSTGRMSVTLAAVSGAIRPTGVLLVPRATTTRLSLNS